MSAADVLTVTGGVLEIAGFGLVVAQLVRVQRREFGTPQTIKRTRTWLWHQVAQLLPRRRKDATVHAASASLSATASMAGHAMAWHNMDPGRADRVDAIAQNLEQLHERVDRLAKKQGDRISDLRRDVDATRAALHGHTAEQEEQRKAELRASITWEAWGVVLFLAGIMCSVAGSLVG